MQKKRSTGWEFDLSGGNLCLDLANTVSRRDDPERRKDHLKSFADLVSFAEQSRTISARQAGALRTFAGQHAMRAQQVLGKAIELREAVYRVFSSIAQCKAPAAADLDVINNFAIEALQHRSLARANGGYRWEWQPDSENPLDNILWPIAQAAADLLTSSRLRNVRWCEAPDCQWLFLDHSRNRSRRWCDMKACGNRQKARRHYQRTHG